MDWFLYDNDLMKGLNYVWDSLKVKNEDKEQGYHFDQQCLDHKL